MKAVVILSIVVFLGVVCATPHDIGEYQTENLKVLKKILTASTIQFEVTKMQEVDSTGKVVVETTGFSDFSFTPGADTDTITASLAGTYTTTQPDTGSQTVEVAAIYAKKTHTLKVGDRTVTVEPRHIKTTYTVKGWPVQSTTNTFKVMAKASWSINDKDLQTVLSSPLEYDFVKDSDGTTVGIKVTKPFNVDFFFPPYAFVDSQLVKLNFDMDFDAVKGVDIEVLCPASGSVIVIDPIVGIDAEPKTTGQAESSAVATAASSLFVGILALVALF